MNPRSVLIIDDAKHGLASLRDSVRKLGHRVITAPHWKDGIAKARAEKPDAILVDVMLPSLSVPDFCNSLKTYTITRGIPVVLVGPKDNSDTFVYGNVAQADFYVVNTFNPTDLAADLYFLFEWRFLVPEESMGMLRITQPIRFDIRRRKPATASDGHVPEPVLVEKPAPKALASDHSEEIAELSRMIHSVSGRLDALIQVLERRDMLHRDELDQKVGEIQEIREKDVSWI